VSRRDLYPHVMVELAFDYLAFRVRLRKRSQDGPDIERREESTVLRFSVDRQGNISLPTSDPVGISHQVLHSVIQAYKATLH
jgi:hypothetical protein